MAKGLLTIAMIVVVSSGFLLVSGCQGEGPSGAGIGPGVRRISVADYADKMKAGWVGPTELVCGR